MPGAITEGSETPLKAFVTGKHSNEHRNSGNI
jgi:hypothetical protein